MMYTLVLTLLGVGLLAATLADLALTLLHPSRRGPFTWPISHGVYWFTHALARRRADPHSVLSFAGPLAMAAHMGVWVFGCWMGYTLIYLGHIDSFTSTSDSFGDHGLLEAMYISGVSLTTIGFGDIVAGTDALRLVTTLEGGTGFVVISGSISYLLSVYPKVSQMRCAAARMYDSDSLSPQGAKRFIVSGRSAELSQLHRDLVEAHQDLKRFPVLALFHPTDARESLSTLFEGAFWVSSQLRWETSATDLPYAPFYAQALHSALASIMDELAAHLTLRGHPPLMLAVDTATDTAEAFEERARAFMQTLSAAHHEERRPAAPG
jgi:hypothetical protein